MTTSKFSKDVDAVAAAAGKRSGVATGTSPEKVNVDLAAQNVKLAAENSHLRATVERMQNLETIYGRLSVVTSMVAAGLTTLSIRLEHVAQAREILPFVRIDNDSHAGESKVSLPPFDN